MLPSPHRLLPIAAVAALALILSAPEADAGVRKGDRASELKNVKDARGKPVRLKAYRGKWVVITFGASWCKPCKKELPAYEKLARKYSDEGVVFIAVNFDEDQKTGKRFMKRAGVRKMRAAFDPRKTATRIYDPPNTPSTYVIDPNGLVRHLHKGYRSGDDRKLARVLDGFLK